MINWHCRLCAFAIRNPQFAILACFILLALVYGLVVPPFENLDEIEHFGAIWYLADQGRLPTHGIPEAEAYHYRQEASQPPLYYLLSAGLVRLLGLQADDMGTFWRFNSHVACGPDAVNLYDNRATLYHDPNREAFPWRGTLLMLHALRVWSTLLQAITVVGTHALGRLIFPQRHQVTWVATAIVAFNPQFLLVASGVNNDNVATPVVTLGLVLLLRIWQTDLSTQRALALGALAGLAGLSKLSGWLLLVLAGLIISLKLVRSPKRCGRLVLNAILIPLVAFSIAGWWLWRNWQLYGDLTALQPMLELVGPRASPTPLLGGFWLMFRSFWGQIPCSFYPPAFYVPYIALCLLALVGLAWGWQKLERTQRLSTTGLAGWFLLVTISWMRWDSLTPASGGRLLFPALPAVALLLATGITHLLPGRLALGNWGIIGLLALLALLAGTWILPGFYAPPSRHANVNVIHPTKPLNATVGDSIHLVGFDFDTNGSEMILDLTLYWQASVPITEDYVMAIQLASPTPGDTTLRWNYNSWPGHGNYPTSAWLPGEVIQDRYRFRLSEAGFPTQAWDLYLILYNEQTGERLPIQIDEINSGTELLLGRLRIPGQSSLCPEEGRLSADVSFEETIALTHASIVSEREETVVMLCWKALEAPPADYTVFVHLQDATGPPVATGDALPMRGAFPTSMWHQGDVILDIHRLPLALDETITDQSVAVGLYRPEDGLRLPARIAETPVPDAAVPIWPDRP